MKDWNSFPMMRLIMPFVLGVVTSSFAVEWVDWSETARITSAVVLGSAVLVSFLLGFWVSSRVFGGVVWLLMSLLGCGLVLSVSAPLFPDGLTEDTLSSWKTFVVKVEDEPQVKDKSVKVVGQVSDEDFIYTDRVLLYFHGDSLSEQIQYGDVLVVRTKLERVENLGNPNEFNYKRYLRFNGIELRGYVGDGKYEFLDSGNPGFWGRLHAIRSSLIEKLEEAEVTGNQLAVASALILGFRADLDQELMSAYAGAGATHVLAVSGLHVGIVYVILNALLKFMDTRRRTKIIKTILLIILLFGYASLTGLSASVFRAATMFSFVAVGKAMKRDTNIFNTLAASAFVLIAFNPMIIMQVGFQLSYAAVIGIVLIQPRLFELISFPQSRLVDWAWSITCVSIAAQIATAPLGLLYFHQFPNFFWVSNLIVIPAAALILYLGFGLFLFSFWKPALLFFGFVLDNLISLLNRVVVKIEEIPYSVLNGIDISTSETLMIYVIIIGSFLFLAKRQKNGLYVALSVGVIFMVAQVYEVHQQHNQQFITVYNVKGQTAIGLFNGNSVTFISDRDFYEDEKAMLFHVRHHWWNRGISDEKFVELTDSVTNRRLRFGQVDLLLLNLSASHEGLFQPIEITRENTIGVMVKLERRVISRLTHLDCQIFVPNKHKDMIQAELDLNHHQNIKFIESAINFKR